ncbi:MAG TPA: DNA polymerase IV [Candidatus Paceibacterota bacterium]|nr:DNA polymerase IV [Candidatus Paceibacterota bacterium]
MANRIIILLDMDYFFAQVEERESPQFKGKPVVVGADPKEGKGRGVVSTANYVARKYGIHSAMPISKAWQLCPTAIFLPPNFELYSRTSENIMNIIRGFSDKVEQTSLDEAYIDVSFCKTYKAAEKIAKDMRKEILEKERLTCSCGVGPSKMIAKIACEMAKPDGIGVVTEKEAEKFVEPLDIEKMPGIGQKTAAILRSSNFQTVADIKKLSEHDLEDLFGVRGKEMYFNVRGIDNSQVETEREAKSIGKEVTFETDTRDPELLVLTFEQLCRQVAQELKEEGQAFKTVTVVCRFSGFETHTKSKTFKEASYDQGLLRAEATKLFLRFLVEKQKPLRLIGVRVQLAPLTKA